jgi:hypothetical protein
MPDGVVAHAYGPARTPSLKLHERLPCLAPELQDRPVDQIEVDVAQPEPAQAHVAGGQRRIVAVVAVPQLCSDEDLLACHPAVSHRSADVLLVPVNTRCVDVSVAYLQGELHGFLSDPSGWRLEHTQPEHGYLQARVELPSRHHRQPHGMRQIGWVRRDLKPIDRLRCISEEV